MGQDISGPGTFYVVLCSNGVVVETRPMSKGERLLLRCDDTGLSYKKLLSDEHCVSRATIEEMIREMTSKN